MGPLIAVIVAELSVHTIRYTTFRTVVFPGKHGYSVNIPSYLASVLPISLTNLTCVLVLRNHLDRTALTLVTASLSMLVGFIWSRFVFSRKWWS